VCVCVHQHAAADDGDDDARQGEDHSDDARQGEDGDNKDEVQVADSELKVASCAAILGPPHIEVIDLKTYMALSVCCL